MLFIINQFINWFLRIDYLPEFTILHFKGNIRNFQIKSKNQIMSICLYKSIHRKQKKKINAPMLI